MPSQLRNSNNGGMEGFEGIVGIGAGGKKASQKTGAAGPGGALKKPGDQTKKIPVKENGPPLSLGIFGSGMQKK